MTVRPGTGVDVVTLGETMALLGSREPGVLRSGATFTFGVGGAETNVAIGLSRLGATTCWIGRLGQDAFGDEVVRALRGEGVGLAVVRDPRRATGLMVKQRRTPVHAELAYYRSGSAGSALAPGDVDTEVVAGARLLHVSGITPALSASAAATVDHAVRTAHDSGVLVSLDVNYRSRLWSPDQASAHIGSLLPFVDVLFAGCAEARLLGADPGDPSRAAQDLSRRGPPEVVITHGATGATAARDGSVSTAAPPTVPVVDTVGAGDAFVAGYLCALLDGQPVPDRLAQGCAAGAFACMARGDWEGAPTRADLELLRTTEPVLR